MTRPNTITSGSGELGADDRDDDATVVIVDITESDLAHAGERLRTSERILRITEELRAATSRYGKLTARTRTAAAWAAMQTRLSLARFDALDAGVISRRLADGSLSDEYVRLSAQLADVARRLSKARGPIIQANEETATMEMS
jgi:hypothetical protein